MEIQLSGAVTWLFLLLGAIPSWVVIVLSMTEENRRQSGRSL